MSQAAGDPPAHGRYRRDIDGLRTLAILPVVFHHLAVPGFGGGFVGVDIFFVISGYLITQVLTDPHRPVSLATFYARRIRRLAPALFVVVAASTVAALILMPPRALQPFAESLICLAGAGSNVYFWKALDGYFAPGAASLPLLHTWSLAVEEQFYFLFPIGLILARGAAPRWRYAGLVGFTAASLLFAAWLAPQSPATAFYLAPTRAWELLVGAMLALRAHRFKLPPSLAAPAGAAGLVLIAVAVITFGPGSLTPGWAALLPCTGAVLLIHAGEIDPTNPASRVLASTPLVGIGLISYALYLWHWPIIVFASHYMTTGPLNAQTKVVIFGVALVMAYLSWRLVERPIRRGALLGATPRAFAAAAAISLTFVAMGLLILRTDGLPMRWPGFAAIALPPSERAWDATFLHGLHRIAPPAPPLAAAWIVHNERTDARKVMLWGDSFAGHLSAGFEREQLAISFSVFRDVAPACPPVIDFDPPDRPECHRHNLEALSRIKNEGFDAVILSAYWQSYLPTGQIRLDQVADTVRRLQSEGVAVLVVGQTPLFDFDYPDEYHYRQVSRGAPRDEGWMPSTVDAGLNPALAAAMGPAFFDPTPVFCQARRCSYRRDGQYMVRDIGHLTAAGSTRLVAALLQTPQLRGAGGTSAEVSRP